MIEETIITVHAGILGTRKLSEAYADLILRRIGLIKEGQAIINRYIAWGQLGHRPWRSDELKRAKKMLASGFRVPTIAKTLGRSKYSVYHKLRDCNVVYRVHPINGGTLCNSLPITTPSTAP